MIVGIKKTNLNNFENRIKRLLSEIIDEKLFVQISNTLIHEVYLYGGFIRDNYYRNRFNDIDMKVVSSLPLPDSLRHFESILRKFGKPLRGNYINKEKSVYRSIFQIENRTFDILYCHDLLSTANDFTVNHLYYDIKKNIYIDMFTSRKDLANKELVTMTPSINSFQDGLGIMHFRFIDMMCTYKFTYSERLFKNLIKTKHLVKRQFENIFGLPKPYGRYVKEGIFRTLDRKPRSYVRWLKKTGIEDEIIDYILQKLNIGTLIHHSIPNPFKKDIPDILNTNKYFDNLAKFLFIGKIDYLVNKYKLKKMFLLNFL